MVSLLLLRTPKPRGKVIYIPNEAHIVAGGLRITARNCSPDRRVEIVPTAAQKISTWISD